MMLIPMEIINGFIFLFRKWYVEHNILLMSLISQKMMHYLTMVWGLPFTQPCNIKKPVMSGIGEEKT